MEHKISLYADDTTLFVEPNETSRRCCMIILNEFAYISGLKKIYIEKIKAMKIGAWRDSRVKLCRDLNSILTDKFSWYNIQCDENDEYH